MLFITRRSRIINYISVSEVLFRMLGNFAHVFLMSLEEYGVRIPDNPLADT